MSSLYLNWLSWSNKILLLTYHQKTEQCFPLHHACDETPVQCPSPLPALEKNLPKLSWFTFGRLREGETVALNMSPNHVLHTYMCARAVWQCFRTRVDRRDRGQCPLFCLSAERASGVVIRDEKCYVCLAVSNRHPPFSVWPNWNIDELIVSLWDMFFSAL